MTADRPAAPAAAYLVVADLMFACGLLKPPPDEGERLTIVGRDGRQTIWDMSEDAAKRLEMLLAVRPTEARIVARESYSTAAPST